MTLSGFWLLWLLLGLGCAGAGAWLTERRGRARELVDGSRALPRCGACGAPAESGARFCGLCGGPVRQSVP